MEKLKVGPPLIEMIQICHSANVPLLVSGKHGIGKSECIEHAAKQMNIDCRVFDLSLMEPPDLVGLPRAEDGKTVYQPPASLPTNGEGIIVFEELNRCERYMRAPCLQLLTARRLNDYRLPVGWLPVAAINPTENDYDVNTLDPALLSRFCKAEAVPDRDVWLNWAETNDVHSDVIQFVKKKLGIFDDSESNPRAWKYVSDVLHKGPSPNVLRAAVMGLVPSDLATAFLRTVKRSKGLLNADAILTSYGKCRSQLHTKSGKVNEAVAALALTALLTKLQPMVEFETVQKNTHQWKNLTRFLADLPPAQMDRATKFFADRKRPFPEVARKRGAK